MELTTLSEQWQQITDDAKRAEFERLHMRAQCYDRERSSRYVVFRDRSLGLCKNWELKDLPFEQLRDLKETAMRKLTALQKDWFVWNRKQKVRAHVKYIVDLDVVIAINQKIVNVE